MGDSAVPQSPKHGFHFDGQECNVVKVRQERKCEGGRYWRGSACPGTFSPDCTVIIKKGDIAVVTILDLFESSTSACLPCSLAIKVIEPVEES